MTYALIGGLFALVIGSVVWLVLRSERLGASVAANEAEKESQDETVDSVAAVEKARSVAPLRGDALLRVLRKRERKLGKKDRS